MSGTQTGLSTRQQYAVIIAAGVGALLLGLLLSPTIAGLVGDEEQAETAPEEAVAVVTVEGQVNQQIAEGLENELRDVRANDSVEAVVVAIDTPGGAPAASERMFSAIQQTNEEMPVIASVGELSASGGYYAMLAAEDIYVHPTSQVGSVGLAALAPEQTAPIEGPSGPDKQGANAIEARGQQELLADVFIESVMEERGDRIELSREEVATAKTFLGVEAVDNGFADEIGSLELAIEDAADRAELSEYAVIERDATPDFSSGIPLPIIVQTDSGFVAVHDEDPGYNDIEPVSAALIYEPAVPHYETIQAFVESDADLSGAASDGGEQP